MEARNEMRLEVLSLPENVAVARVTVASFAAQMDFTLGQVEEIKVAVSEAVSNAVVHGYRGTQGVVRVIARVYADRLEIEVSDSGTGIPDVNLARQASYTTDPERMGLGFTFMESFMDGLEVDSQVGSGTTVRMVKRYGECAYRGAH